MLKDNYLKMKLGKQKKIALIAHDSKKQQLVEFARMNHGL